MRDSLFLRSDSEQSVDVTGAKDKWPRVPEPNVRAVRQAAGAQMDVDQILLFWEIFVYVW